MRFVAVKSEVAKAGAAIFRTRDLLVRQPPTRQRRLRPGDRVRLGRRQRASEPFPKLLALAHEVGSTLPLAARAMLDVLIDMVAALKKRITALDREIATRAKTKDESAWLDDDPRHWLDHRNRHRGPRSTGGAVP